jgi:oxidoreductase
VYDPDPAAAAALTGLLPGSRAETSEEACLEAPAAAVLVASPSPTHFDLSLRALRAGRHVLCEKPVAVRQSQADELRRAERDGSRRLAGAVVCRHRADVRQWLRWSSRVGEIRELELTWVRSRGVPSPGSWHTQVSDGWTGVVADLGYHLADLAVAVLNRPVEAVGRLKAEVTSAGNGGGASWYGAAAQAGYLVSDRAEAVLAVDGVLVSLCVSWVDEAPGDVTRLVAVGSDGRAEFEGLFGVSNQRRIAAQRCSLRRGSRVVEEKAFRPGPALHLEAFGGVLDEFAGVCRGAEPLAGVGQISATAALLEAVNGAEAFV